MKGNLSSGNTIACSSSYGGLDLQGSMRDHHQQLHLLTLHQQHHSLPTQRSIPENFPLTMSSIQDCGQSLPLSNFVKGERGNFFASDEDERSFTEDASDSHVDANGVKKEMPWQRVKWTDKMVRVLITAVSYIGEDVAAEYGNGSRRKYANLQKIGKWKSVSKVMAERGHSVSPQQCEDKFNDLNKRYKRLNEILGRGTSCQVVERPELLDLMDDLSEKVKVEVRKILSSKQLFYEEMCSYHNGNRLHLPHDPELQRSVWLALRSRDDHENYDANRHMQEDLDEDVQDAETDDRDEFEGIHALHGDCRATHGFPVGFSKRMKHYQGHEFISLNSLDCSRTFNSNLQDAQYDVNQVLSEGVKENLLQKQWMQCRSLQLEEQRILIQEQMLELEKERFKWQRFCMKGDLELEKMRVENETMKLENERMALALKRKELVVDHN